MQHVRSFLTQVLCSTPSFQDTVQQDSREIDSLQMELSEPQSYFPMHHQDFKVELLKFRTKSKSWTMEQRKQDQITCLVKL
ncbi:PREDICTED: M-phase inducer phosphatase 3 [Aptenodytes forsteri]|uniref:M-phase inducer phosphatase 3 n=1 Tax=Aptenodytes forsteri TaxID=9233 RepID=UPI0004F460A8|nr:PREDICTED: M-phase inducer phosphatase 3 [Aptenodytes forsteri]